MPTRMCDAILSVSSCQEKVLYSNFLCTVVDVDVITMAEKITLWWRTFRSQKFYPCIVYIVFQVPACLRNTMIVSGYFWFCQVPYSVRQLIQHCIENRCIYVCICHTQECHAPGCGIGCGYTTFG